VTELTYPYGQALASGCIKQQPEDFKVCERLGFELTGQGEHLFLEIEKTAMTTAELIDVIAGHTGVAPRHIGYSGLKDKQAVTSQWISVQLPGCKQIPDIPNGENYRILNSTWHDKKLRVGVHKFNDFEIIIRQLEGNLSDIALKIDQIKHSGFANYFGEQRFGSNQDNVEQAIKVFTNTHKRKRLSRNKKSLYLSALRSELFNRILSYRISQGHWMQPVTGDLFLLAGSQSMFSEILDDALIQRYQQLDIHTAVSLMGTGESKIIDAAQDLENAVIAAFPDIVEILNRQDVKRSYRSNRALAHRLEIDYLDQNTLKLSVSLEKGVFLTSLLNHFVSI
jgi:tRNA pseudouridine13 synthase